jgi:hypothetical protein
MRAASAVCVLILAIAFVGTGCIPYYLQETPRVTGRVINAADQGPVEHARLHYTMFPKEIVIASADGTFDFRAIHRWQLVPLGPLDRFYDLHLLVEAPGYHTEELRFQPGVLDMTNQTISLQPQ